MKIRKNAYFVTGGILSGILMAVILVGFFWTPYSTTAMNAAEKMKAPSLKHLLGTDNFGRDVFSRVVSGMGTSFLIALMVVVIGCFFGILIGSLCGYYGGIADLVLMRICDTITAFPAILLALVIISVVGGGSGNIVIARTQFAVCRSQNYISSAKLMGVSGLRILFFHILPNTFSVLLPSVTIGFNNAVLAEASMSFLGIGIQPPQASLGSMLKDSQTYLKSAPWYALGTGLAVVLLVLAFSLLSEGIQQGSRRQ